MSKTLRFIVVSAIVLLVTGGVIWLAVWSMQVHPEEDWPVDAIVLSLAGLEDERALAIGYERHEAVDALGTLELLNLKKGTTSRPTSVPVAIVTDKHSVACDGKSLVAGGSGLIAIYDVNTLHLLREVPLDAHSISLALDETHVCAGGWDGFVYRIDLISGKTKTVFDPNTPIPLPRRDVTDVQCLGVRPDAHELLIGQPGGVIVWDLRMARPRLCIQCSPHAMSISPDGAQMATTDGSKIDFWDLNDGRRITEVKGEFYLGEIQHLAYSQDGIYLVACNTGETHSASFLAVCRPSDRRYVVFQCDTDVVHGMSFLRGTNRLVTGGSAKRVRIWNLDKLTWPAKENWNVPMGTGMKF